MLTVLDFDICHLMCFIPTIITYILIIGILCLDVKLFRIIPKTQFQCSVVRDFLLILVTVQTLLMIILGIQKYEMARKLDLIKSLDVYFEITTIAFTYIDLLFHMCISLGFLYYLRHRNMTDSEKRRLLIKQTEKEK